MKLSVFYAHLISVQKILNSLQNQNPNVDYKWATSMQQKGELLNKLWVTPKQPLGNLWETTRQPWGNIWATAWKPWSILGESLRATWKQPRSNCKEILGQPLGNKIRLVVFMCTTNDTSLIFTKTNLYCWDGTVASKSWNLDIQIKFSMPKKRPRISIFSLKNTDLWPHLLITLILKSLYY